MSAFPSGKMEDKGSYFTPQQLGAFVRRQRQRQGLRQAELAALTGCGPRFIGELERGKQTLQWGKVLKVLQGLGIVLHAQAPEGDELEVGDPEPDEP